jgi:hypothetical protein
VPIQAVALFKAWVYGHSLDETTGLNSAGGMDVRLLCCCVLSGIGLCDGPIPRPQLSYCMCMIVIRCNNNPLHLE